MRTYTPAKSILFDGTATNLLSVLCIVTEILSCVHAKGEKGINGFKVGTFFGHFKSDSVASTPVNGLV